MTEQSNYTWDWWQEIPKPMALNAPLSTAWSEYGFQGVQAHNDAMFYNSVGQMPSLAADIARASGNAGDPASQQGAPAGGMT